MIAKILLYNIITLKHDDINLLQKAVKVYNKIKYRNNKLLCSVFILLVDLWRHCSLFYWLTFDSLFCWLTFDLIVLCWLTFDDLIVLLVDLWWSHCSIGWPLTSLAIHTTEVIVKAKFVIVWWFLKVVCSDTIFRWKLKDDIFL